MDYYYPYFLHLQNMFSFTYYNMPDTDFDSSVNNSKTVDLWSITRPNGHFHKTEYVATYNYYTRVYELAGKRYTLYSDMVNAAYLL